ncbi:hypothetical protein EW146_g8848 [Bondarzewia mesenterica]|uniref:Uncharacterized protein n=1 Tax=Bondarzewia mesenterica TaxID=1095465 RepID=A0A4S4LCL4_9AGAM|nr:hypothetical protein EW146_g8848 [Bondarzewia mesenterica]
MPWPSKITRAFTTAERAGHDPFLKNPYYGPYNKLLSTLFPLDSDFIVSFNFLPGDVDGGEDLFISFEVTLYSTLSFPGPADRQIHHRLMDMSGDAILPVLYGISAIGTKLCFYEHETAQRCMSPQHILNDPDLITNVMPKEQWDCDVLEADGEQRLRALVGQIMEACEHLQT